MKRKPRPTVRLALYDLETPEDEIVEWIGLPFTLDRRGSRAARQTIRMFNESAVKEGLTCMALAVLPYDPAMPEYGEPCSTEFESDGGAL